MAARSCSGVIGWVATARTFTAAELPLPLRGKRASAPAGAERRPVGWRTRDRGAAAVGAVGSGVLALARLAWVITGLIVLLIVAAIVLVDVDANAGNTIVKGIHEGANFFAGAFTGLIEFSGHPKRAITVDWGIAALVFLLVGGLIATTIARVGWSRRRFELTHRPAL
jgi:hypothetical protein